MALPNFGLMLKSDKEKLDAIDTATLLTKTEASTTYATKAEMREYVKQVLESDTGYVFLNGAGSEVGLIPAFTKPKPTLSVDPSAVTSLTKGNNTFTVTTNSDGAISAIITNGSTTVATGEDIYTALGGCNYDSFSISGNIITLHGTSEPPADMHVVLRITVAETDNYAAATVDVPIDITGM